MSKQLNPENIKEKIIQDVSKLPDVQDNTARDVFEAVLEVALDSIKSVVMKTEAIDELDKKAIVI